MRGVYFVGGPKNAERVEVTQLVPVISIPKPTEVSAVASVDLSPMGPALKVVDYRLEWMSGPKNQALTHPTFPWPSPFVRYDRHNATWPVYVAEGARTDPQFMWLFGPSELR